jgi:hypothetical protein
MTGSCEPPEPGKIWSLYSVRKDIPQAPEWDPETAAPPQVCPKSTPKEKILISWSTASAFSATRRHILMECRSLHVAARLGNRYPALPLRQARRL